ncbi:MAG TPA: protein translocase subunit SecD, partial [Gammaproteobacteria bacterium]
MNRYPLWKNLLVIVVIVGGIILALPNLFGDDPALHITREDGNPMNEFAVAEIRNTLEEQEIGFIEADLDGAATLVRFADVADQLTARETLGEALPNHVVALTLAPRTPPLLEMLGLRPMSLGLDLRGGVHFLYQVDLDTAIQQLLESHVNTLRNELREADIRNRISLVGDVIDIPIVDEARVADAGQIIRRLDPLLQISSRSLTGEPGYQVRLSPIQITERQN